MNEPRPVITNHPTHKRKPNMVDFPRQTVKRRQGNTREIRLQTTHMSDIACTPE